MSYHPGHGHRERKTPGGPQRRGFARPADSADVPRTGPLVFEERTTETSAAPVEDQLQVHNNPYASLNIQQQRIRLPIFKVRGFQTAIVLNSKFFRTAATFCTCANATGQSSLSARLDAENLHKCHSSFWKPDGLVMEDKLRLPSREELPWLR